MKKTQDIIYYAAQWWCEERSKVFFIDQFILTPVTNLLCINLHSLFSFIYTFMILIN